MSDSNINEQDDKVNQSLVSRDLEQLFSAGDEQESNCVPGEGSSLPQTASPLATDRLKLAEALELSANEQSSALSKSRGLLIASQLYQEENEEERSFTAAQQAAGISPKLGLASLYLRKKAKRRLDGETAERTLQTSARLAADKSSRVHAIGVYASFLEREERFEEAGELLDQSARSGNSTTSLLLRRIIFRLTQGESLAGVEIPSHLDSPIKIAQEVLGSPASAEECSELIGLRAARQLALGNTHEWEKHLLKDLLKDTPSTLSAGQTSVRLEIWRDGLSELNSALLSCEPNEGARSLTLLKGLARQRPSRRVLRTLAARCVEECDQQTLEQVLGLADPGSGTFTLIERWFLSGRANIQLQLSEEEAHSLSHDEPALALALGPDELPALRPEEASETSLLVQLGAAMLRLRSEASATSPLLSESGIAALEELNERSTQGELCEALGLLRSVSLGHSLESAKFLDKLSSRANSAAGLVMAGALLQRNEETDAAELAYSSALKQVEDSTSDSSTLALAAIQGLLSLENQEKSELLLRLSETSHSVELKYAQQLESALSLPDEERGHDLLKASTDLFETELLAASPLRSQSEHNFFIAALSGLLLASSSLAEQAGAKALADDARRLLSEHPSTCGRMVAFRELWETTISKDKEEESTISLRKLFSSSSDASERAIARFSLDSKENEQTSPSSKISLGQNVPVECTMEMAKAIIQNDLSEATSWGKNLTDIDPIIPSLLRDLDSLGGAPKKHTSYWLDRAQNTNSDDIRRYAYERLASLDSARGDLSGAMLWRKTLAEEYPKDLPSLLRLEEIQLSEGTGAVLEGSSLQSALPPGDREPYSLVAGAVALANSKMRDANRHLSGLLDQGAPPLLAARGVATAARERRDDEMLFSAVKHLTSDKSSDLDRCSTALATALLLSRMGRQEEAISWTRRALAARGGAFAAHQLLHHLNQPKHAVEQAEQLEQFACSVAAPQHRVELWLECAQVWEKAEDPDRAILAYLNTLKSAPEHQDAFDRLCFLYKRQELYPALENLLAARLKLLPEQAKERLTLEVSLSETLMHQGKALDAKIHLESALLLDPTKCSILRAHADVSAELGEHQSAEKSLSALLTKTSDPSDRKEILRSLGHLYDEHLGQLENAMDALQAVLKIDEKDDETATVLIRVYCRLGLAERATALQTKLIQSATSPKAKRAGALNLAKLYETVANDPKRAAATLERTRKAWPLDADVLQAVVEFMDRQGTAGQRGFLLDRAKKDARRKLETERLDGALLETLARVAQLTGKSALCESTTAAQSAYLGKGESALKGAGLNALDPRIDDLLSPYGLTAPLRALLRKTGAAMDAAFSVDLSSVGAEPLKEGKTFDRIAQIAAALNSTAPEIYVSKSLGAKCIPLTTEPARLLVGKALDELAEQERDYLILRGLKMRWLGVGALLRSKEEDAWPMLVALLHLFAPNWRPTSVDMQKTVQAKALIEQRLAQVGYDDDVPMLALEAIGSIGEHGARFAQHARALAERTALLGVGDPAVALSALAASEGKSLPASGPSRFRFLNGNEAARDILLFAASENCATARVELSLARRDSTPELNPSPKETPRRSAPRPPLRRPPPPKRS